MKRLILILMLVATGFASGLVMAQINVNINVDSQPKWGPRGHNYVESYYLPEYDLYYNVPKRGYYYAAGKRWLFSPALPARYRQINLYQTPKIVLTDRYPYKKHKIHYKQYAGYRVDHDPKLITRNHKPGHSVHPPKYKFAKAGYSPKKRFHKEHFKHSKHKHHKGGSKKHR